MVKQRCLWGGFGRECCPALRSRRPFRFGDGVPARPCRAKRGMGIPGVPNISSQRKYWGGFRGGGRRAEPGLRTSRLEKPAAVYAPQGYSRKKPSPPGLFRYKEGSFRRTAFCLKKSQKFSLVQKHPPRVVRRQRPCGSISWEKEERPTTLARLNPPHIFSLRSNKRGPRVWGYVSQKRATGGSGPKRSEREAAPADPPPKPTPDFLTLFESPGAGVKSSRFQSRFHPGGATHPTYSRCARISGDPGRDYQLCER